VNTKRRKKYNVGSIVELITAKAYIKKKCESHIDIIGESWAKIT
jgi:hypothetical protein